MLICMSESFKLGALDPITVHCYNLVLYHDFAMVIMSGVMTFILVMMTVILYSKEILNGYTCRYMYRNDFWEFWWATIPMFLLISMGVWSWSNLYAMEVGGNVKHHAKVIGHQWYWEYEYFMDYSAYNAKAGSTLGFISTGVGSETVKGKFNFLRSSLSFWWVSVKIDRFLSDRELWKPSSSLKPYSVGVTKLFYMLQVEKDNEKKPPMKYKVKPFPALFHVSKEEKWQYLGVYKKFQSFIPYEKVGLDECYNDGHGHLVGWLSLSCGDCSIGQCVYSYDSYGWDIFGELKSSELDEVSEKHWTILMLYDRNAVTTRDFFIPMDEVTEISISTADVIHSWGVPSLGVKMDAVPGRLNHIGVSPLLPGAYSGNCYELCGYGHSVMPINVIAVIPSVYRNMMQYLALSSH